MIKGPHLLFNPEIFSFEPAIYNSSHIMLKHYLSICKVILYQGYDKLQGFGPRDRIHFCDMVSIV